MIFIMAICAILLFYIVLTMVDISTYLKQMLEIAEEKQHEDE